MKRDLALLLDENVSFAELRKTAISTEKKLLKSVALFDVYKGDKIPEGKKQYALSFVLQDLEKTLNDKAVEAVMAKLLKAFQDKHGATFKSLLEIYLLFYSTIFDPINYYENERKK